MGSLLDNFEIMAGANGRQRRAAATAAESNNTGAALYFILAGRLAGLSDKGRRQIPNEPVAPCAINSLRGLSDKGLNPFYWTSPSAIVDRRSLRLQL